MKLWQAVYVDYRAGFSPDQAELSSIRYAVEFSLSRHFNALLKWLRNGEDKRGRDEY